jgi:hypothetical protein
MPLEFEECPSCRAKPGSPDLCRECLIRRQAVWDANRAEREAEELAKRSKETNPKDLRGMKRVPMHLVPQPVIAELSLAFLEGAIKYGAHNYRVTGVRATVYIAAALRHIVQYLEGEDHDPEVLGGVKISHLTKAIACLAVIRDADRLGKLHDDRPPKHEDGWLRELHDDVEKMLTAASEVKEPYTQKGNVTVEDVVQLGESLERLDKQLAWSNVEPKKEDW